MDKKTLALVHLLVRESVKKITLPPGPQGDRGPRGFNGKDGNDFSLESHSEEILKLVKDNFKFELSAEELETLKGKDGKSVSILEVLPLLEDKLLSHISENKEMFRLKFSDLSESEILSIKGERGEKGSKGKDFSLENSKELLNESLNNLFVDKKDELKLKFSDLSEEDILSLKGEKGDPGERGKEGKRGLKGENGKDFSFEENLEKLKSLFLENKSDFSLRFTDLTDEERDSLKLTFSQLTPEEQFLLRGEKGPRGQKGKRGEKGDTGERGDRGATWTSGTEFPDNPQENDLVFNPESNDVFQFLSGRWEVISNLRGMIGPIGLTGEKGERGFKGANGKDGKDAPEIVNVELEEDIWNKRHFRIVLYFSDDTFISSNYLKFPETTVYNHFSNSYSSNSNNNNSTLVDATLIKGVNCSPDVYVGSFVRMTEADVIVNALADSYANSNVLGLVVGKESETVCDVRVSGVSNEIFTGLDTTVDYYLSATVPGGMSPLVPTGVGEIKLKLGQSFGERKFLLQKGERVVRS